MGELNAKQRVLYELIEVTEKLTKLAITLDNPSERISETQLDYMHSQYDAMLTYRDTLTMRLEDFLK